MPVGCAHSMRSPRCCCGGSGVGTCQRARLRHVPAGSPGPSGAENRRVARRPRRGQYPRPTVTPRRQRGADMSCCCSRNRRFRALGTFGPYREGSGSVDWRDVRGRGAAGRGQFRRGPGPAGAPCPGWRAAGCLARRLRSRAGRPGPGRPARLGAAGSGAGQGARRELDRPRGRGSCATEVGGDRPWRWTVPGAGC